MKLLIQRVSQASVCIDDTCFGRINSGLLIFIGIGVNDTKADIKYLARKVSKLRVFEDPDKKIKYSLTESNGQILLVSQFTLYGDCSKGNRPSFSSAALADKGELFYNNFIIELKELGINPVLGEFGANMQVELINDGPMTLLLESEGRT